MPKQTFFNIAKEKRERIIKASIDEFSEYSFNEASIARIVENAGIPRGSFYQYFEDMKDVYKYIFYITGQEKMDFINNALLEMEKGSIFQTLRDLYSVGIKFAHSKPQLAKVGSRFLKESDSLKNEIFGQFEEKTIDFFKNLLKKGVEKGEISKKVDIDIAAGMIYQLNISIADYFISKPSEGDIMSILDKYLGYIDKMLYIFENGLKSE